MRDETKPTRCAAGRCKIIRKQMATEWTETENVWVVSNKRCIDFTAGYRYTHSQRHSGFYHKKSLKFLTKTSTPRGQRPAPCVGFYLNSLFDSLISQQNKKTKSVAYKKIHLTLLFDLKCNMYPWEGGIIRKSYSTGREKERT